MITEPGREQAAALARKSVSDRLGQPWYAAAVAQLGFSAQELTEVSERLITAIVAHGDPATIATKVREHLAAGADHVVLMPSAEVDFTIGVDRFVRLGPALTEIT